MTDEAISKGWVVRVTMLRPGGGQPIVDLFDIALPILADAVEAARKASGSDAGAIVETIGQLPSTTHLRSGEVVLR